jgi:hypothetical protein
MGFMLLAILFIFCGTESTSAKDLSTVSAAHPMESHLYSHPISLIHNQVCTLAGTNYGATALDSNGATLWQTTTISGLNGNILFVTNIYFQLPMRPPHSYLAMEPLLELLPTISTQYACLTQVGILFGGMWELLIFHPF